MFPLRCDRRICVRVSFKLGRDKLVVEKWEIEVSPYAWKLEGFPKACPLNNDYVLAVSEGVCPLE